jgi:hypothetical protein
MEVRIAVSLANALIRRRQICKEGPECLHLNAHGDEERPASDHARWAFAFASPHSPDAIARRA